MKSEETNAGLKNSGSNPFFQSKEQISYYDQAVSHPESRYFSIILGLIADLDIQKEHYLDIGSGTGHLGHLLKDRFSRIDLVDSSPVMCDLSKRRNRDCSHVYQHHCDFESFVPPVGRYDLITCVHVVGGFFLERGFLKKINDMLRGKAVFILLKPYRDKFYSDELYPILFGEQKKFNEGKFKIQPFVENLLSEEIDFELRNVQFELVQEFGDFEEVMSFWAMYLPDRAFDREVLKNFLLTKVESDKGKFYYRNQINSAVITF